MFKLLLIAGSGVALSALLYFSKEGSHAQSSTAQKAIVASPIASDRTEPLVQVDAAPGSSLLQGLNNLPAATLPAKQTVPVQPTTNGPIVSNRASQNYATVSIGNRVWNLLDGKGAVGGSGQQAMVVLQDQKSGQLEYRQSALRFVLNPGEDYEAFIRSLAHGSRRYVSVLYGEVHVPIQHIGTVYADMSRDSRVAKVHFIPLDVQVKPK